MTLFPRFPLAPGLPTADKEITYERGAEGSLQHPGKSANETNIMKSFDSREVVCDVIERDSLLSASSPRQSADVRAFVFLPFTQHSFDTTLS